MIHALPPEIISIIVHYVQINSADKRYINYQRSGGLHAWNNCCPEKLLSLAHTCKYLKSVLYPLIFRYFACYKLNYDSENIPEGPILSRLDYLDENNMYVTCFLPPRQSRYYSHGYMPDQFDSSISSRQTPQFYLSGLMCIATDAHKYIQHLGLVFDEASKPYYPWLGPLLSMMSSLQDVTLNFSYFEKVSQMNSLGGFDFTDALYVVEQLLRRKNTIRVHLLVKLFHETPDDKHKYFRDFIRVVASMTRLKLETVIIHTSTSDYKFPLSFCQLLGQMNCLKRFIVKPEYRVFSEGRPGDQDYHSITDLTRWLGGLSNLEEITLDSLLQKDVRESAVETWNLSSPLKNICMPLSRLLRCNNESMITSVTQLHVHFPWKGTDLPVFFNLTTLVLSSTCHHDDLEVALLQFSKRSPLLANLVFLDCSIVGEMNLGLTAALAKIRQVEIYNSDIDFKQVIKHAPCLRRLVYDPSPWIGCNIPFKWFFFMALQGNVANELHSIQFRYTHNHAKARKVEPDCARKCWLKANRFEYWPTRKADFLREKICLSTTCTLDITVPLLVQHARKFPYVKRPDVPKFLRRFKQT